VPRPSPFSGGLPDRLCRLFDDAGRERVRRVQNEVIGRIPPPPSSVLAELPADLHEWYLNHWNQVADPYLPDQDILFRHKEDRDVDDWMACPDPLLPGALEAVAIRLT